MANRNILYGDDNEQNRVKVAQALEARGYQVDLVNAPQEILERARNGNYRVVLSDIDYTENGGEGYELVRQIRNLPSLKVLFSGRTGFENVAEGLEAGADFVVLGKNLEALLNILEKELKGGKEENGTYCTY